MSEVAGTIPVLAQRAASEGPRWTRAVGIIPATPYEVIVRCGRADGHFEHPVWCTIGIPSVLKNETWAYPEMGFQAL
jgi:hypothetical protein